MHEGWTKENFKVTPRLREVWELVSKGYSNEEIAKELFVSRKTIENYLNLLYEIVNLNLIDDRKYIKRVILVKLWYSNLEENEDIKLNEYPFVVNLSNGIKITIENNKKQ